MPVTWNPADKASDVTLSNGNLSATSSSTGSVRASEGKSTGKFYFEAQLVGEPKNVSLVGVGPGGADLSSYILTDPWVSFRPRYGWIYVDGSLTQIRAQSLDTGLIIGFAVDCSTRTVWVSVGGVWLAGGDPAAGTGGYFLKGSGAIFPAVSPDTATLVARFSAADQTYSAPTGFSAWDSVAAPVVHGLTAANLTLAAPVLSAPALSQVHALSAASLVLGAPVLSAPALSVEAPAPRTFLLGSTAITSRYVGANIYTRYAGASSEWPVEQAAVHDLVAASITLGAPVLSAPALSQVHALSASSILIGAPVLAAPALTVQGSAPAFSKGFNLRATAGYVTDPAGTTYLTTQAYPVTRNDVTFGWVVSSGLTSRDRSLTPDPRLAGTIGAARDAPRDIRVDLPTPGRYKVLVAAGDYSFAQTAGRLRVYDNTTLLHDTGEAAFTHGGANNFRDLTLAQFSHTTFFAGATWVEFDFATTTFILRLAGSTTGASCYVAHFGIERVS